MLILTPWRQTLWHRAYTAAPELPRGHRVVLATREPGLCTRTCLSRPRSSLAGIHVNRRRSCPVL
jgi:hypothetical protein